MEKVIAAEWSRGSIAERARTLADGKWLYAADAGGIVVIDVKKGKIKNKIAIPRRPCSSRPRFDGKGTLYVSDSKGKKVFVVKDGKAHVYLDEGGAQGAQRVVSPGRHAVRARQQ